MCCTRTRMRTSKVVWGSWRECKLCMSTFTQTAGTSFHRACEWLLAGAMEGSTRVFMIRERCRATQWLRRLYMSVVYLGKS